MCGNNLKNCAGWGDVWEQSDEGDVWEQSDGPYGLGGCVGGD